MVMEPRVAVDLKVYICSPYAPMTSSDRDVYRGNDA
jgi:hypothetical protein